MKKKFSICKLIVAGGLALATLIGNSGTAYAAETNDVFSVWTELNSESTYTGTIDLNAGGKYKVTHNLAVTGADASNALTVTGTVDLYIARGVTLTVTGGNASGLNGAGAGIYLPEDAVLNVFGAGKLVAYGGNAADGGAGETNKKDASMSKSANAMWSGSGGNGGNGGGGAGAGIGGSGGNGGAGGVGGASVRTQTDKGCHQPGKDGTVGDNGNAGVGMGTLRVYDTVTIEARGGAGSTIGGARPGRLSGNVHCNGGNGYSADDASSGFNNDYQAGAGGVGGGGGSGFPAANIGGGGAGGAGGGGGASGGGTTNDCDNGSGPYAAGGHGLGGKGYYDGNASTGNGYTSYGDSRGGYGGAGGQAGTGGQAGAVYISGEALVNGCGGGAGGTGAGSERSSLSAVTINANGGSFEGSETQSTYAYSGYHLSCLEKNPTRLGYTYQGIFSAQNGGDLLIDTGGTPTSTAWTGGNVYAQWVPNEYILTITPTGLDKVEITEIIDGVDGETTTLDFSLSNNAQTYVMTYDRQYRILATPGLDSEGKDKTFIAWYAGKSDGIDRIEFNCTDNPYTIDCPAFDLPLTGVAMKGVTAWDKIKIHKSDFTKDITYVTATVNVKLDDEFFDMGPVVLKSLEKTEGKYKTYNLTGENGIYTYTREKDEAPDGYTGEYAPMQYEVLVSDVPVGIFTDFGSSTSVTVNYYTATVKVFLDEELTDMGAFRLVSTDTDEEGNPNKIIPLNYDDITKTYSYYTFTESDEAKTEGQAGQERAYRKYAVQRDGKDMLNARSIDKLVDFDATLERSFFYSSMTVKTTLDGELKYLGPISLRTVDANNQSTTVYTLTGNNGVSTLTIVGKDSTEYTVFVGSSSTGKKVAFSGLSRNNDITIPYYSVSFDGNGNNSGTAPSGKIVLEGSSITLPTRESLVKNEAVFDGWFRTSDPTDVLEARTQTVIDEATVFMAHWISTGECQARWKTPVETEWHYGTLTEAVEVMSMETSGFALELLKDGTLPTGVTVESNETFRVTSDAVLTVVEGDTFTNEGKLVIEGVVKGNNATLNNKCIIENVSAQQSQGVLAISTVNNEGGSIHGGKVGLSDITVKVNRGVISGEIYLEDNSTFNRCAIDGSVYFEKKETGSYKVTTDTSMNASTKYYLYKDSYLEYQLEPGESRESYYVKIDEKYYQYGMLSNAARELVKDDAQLYKKETILAGQDYSETINPHDEGYLVYESSVVYEPTSDKAKVSGKKYYVLSEDEYIETSTPDFSNVTKISVMGGTTIVNTPTEDQLKYNLGGIVIYNEEEGSLKLQCCTIFRQPVLLSGDGIEIDNGGFPIEGVDSAQFTLITGYSEEIEAERYILKEGNGGYACATYGEYSTGDTCYADKSVVSGTEITFKATASTGYEFVGWYEGLETDTEGNIIGGAGEPLSTSPNYSTALIGEKTFYALFSIIKVNVTVQADEGVDVTITRGDTNDSIMLEAGDEVTFPMMYGYGITLGEHIAEGCEGTYFFNGWYERCLVPGDDFNKEFPVDSMENGNNGIEKGDITINNIITDRTFLATSGMSGFIHYDMNGGHIEYIDETTGDPVLLDSLNEKIDKSEIKKKEKAITPYAPTKEGWEFLYYTDNEGNRYRNFNDGKKHEGYLDTINVYETGSKTPGRTLMAVFTVNVNSQYWVNTYGYSTLDAAVAATLASNSPVYGEKEIIFDDSGLEDKTRIVYGELPDGYLLTTLLNNVVLTVDESHTLKLGHETGTKDIPANKNVAGDRSWLTGAEVRNIALEIASGGGLLFDGQRSHIDREIRLQPDTLVNLVSEINTNNEISLVLLDEEGNIDIDGDCWNGEVIVQCDATDGDDSTDDASKDQKYDYSAGRIKIANASGGVRTYLVHNNCESIDTAANKGYSFTAQKIDGIPAAMVSPLNPIEELRTEYYDPLYVEDYNTLDEALSYVSRHNSGSIGQADGNIVYMLKDAYIDQGSSLHIKGDDSSDTAGTFLKFKTTSLTYNREVVICPANYSVTGDNYSILRADTAEGLSRIINGDVSVEPVKTGGTVLRLMNIKITGTVGLGKDCIIRLDETKHWGDNEKITLKPTNLIAKTILVDCGGVAADAILSKFKLTDELIREGYVLYYDSVKDAIILDYIGFAYGIDETIEGKADGQLVNLEKRMEYIAKADYDNLTGGTYSGANPWIEVTSDREKVAVGKYYVRIKETSTSTVSTAYGPVEVGPGRKLEVLFRQKTDGLGSGFYDIVKKVIYNGEIDSSDIPAINARNGYEAVGWQYNGNPEPVLLTPEIVAGGVGISGIKEDMLVEAIYSKKLYTINLPVSCDRYTVYLEDGTVVNEANHIRSEEYGSKFVFKYEIGNGFEKGKGFAVNCEEVSDDNTHIDDFKITPNAEDVCVISPVLNNCIVTITGIRTVRPPIDLYTVSETEAGLNDGKIGGFDPSPLMEFISMEDYDPENPDAGWSDLTRDTEDSDGKGVKTGVAPGTYYVRYKETQDDPHGDIVPVVVGAARKIEYKLNMTVPEFEDMVYAATPSTRQVMLYNAGDGEVKVTSITLAGDNEDAFEISANCPITISGNRSEGSVSLSPKSNLLPGVYYAQVVTDWEGGGESKTPLKGNISIIVEKRKVSAPAGLQSHNTITEGGIDQNKGSITGIDPEKKLEVKRPDSDEWEMIENVSELINLPQGEYEFRYPENETDEASPSVKIKVLSDEEIYHDISLSVEELKEIVYGYSIDSTSKGIITVSNQGNSSETVEVSLTGANASSFNIVKAASLNAVNTPSVEIAEGAMNREYAIIPKTGLNVGEYTVTVKASYIVDGITYTKFRSCTLKIKKSIPEIDGIAGEPDGDLNKIVGLDDDVEYEYRKKGEDTWIPVEPGSDEVPGLPDGVYEIRKKETDNSEPSAIVEVELTNKIAGTIRIPDIDLGIVSYSSASYDKKPVYIISECDEDKTVVKMSTDNEDYFEVIPGNGSIAPGKTDSSWTIHPVDGLPVRNIPYTARLTLIYGNGKSCIANVTVIIEKSDREPPEGLTGKEETVWGGNDGHVAGLEDGIPYEYSLDGENFFPLDENTDLPAQDVFVRIGGDENYNPSLPVIVTIPDGKKPQYKLTMSVPKFASVKVGYNPVDAMAIGFENTGNTDVRIQKVIIADKNRYFTINGPENNTAVVKAASSEVMVGSEAAEYTITPFDGLAKGTYKGTVIAYYTDGGKNESKVTFRVGVSNSPKPDPGDNPGGNDNGDPDGGNGDDGGDGNNPDNGQPIPDGVPDDDASDDDAAADTVKPEDLSNPDDEEQQDDFSDAKREGTEGNASIELMVRNDNELISETNSELNVEVENINELLDELLTDKDRELIGSGNNIKIVVTLRILGEKDVDTSTLATIKKFIEDIPETETGSKMKFGSFLRLDITKQIGTGQPELITDCADALRVSAQIPVDLIKDGRTYYIMVCNEDGIVEIIPSVYNGDGTVSFEAVANLKYSLCYTDLYEEEADKSETILEDNKCFIHWIALIAVVAFLIILLLWRSIKNSVRFVLAAVVGIVALLSIIAGHCGLDIPIGIGALIVDIAGTFLIRSRKQKQAEAEE